MSSQIDSQPVNAQPYPQNHAIGMNTSPEGVAPDFTKGSQTYPIYPQPDPNQNLHNGSDHPRPYNSVPPISTNVMSSASGPVINYTNGPGPQNQPDPALASHSPFSNLAVTSTATVPPQHYPNNFQEPMYRTNSYASQEGGGDFSPLPAVSQNGSLKGLKQMKKALTGLDRQLNGLFIDDRTGRGLLSSSQTNLPGVAKQFTSRRNTQT